MRELTIILFTLSAVFVFGTGVMNAAPLEGKVAPYKGRPVIFVNDEPHYPMIYSITEGGRFTWEETPSRNLTNFGELGFRLFQIDTWFRDIWKPDGSLDMDVVRRQVKGVTDVCPSAAVFIRLHIDAPPWWCQQNPDECVGYAAGPVTDSGNDIDRALRNSMASEKWRKEATEKLREFCRILSSSPEGDSVVGIHLAGGVYAEWHYFGFPHEPDTGVAMTKYFRNYLRDKYSNNETLRLAWGYPEADLNTVVPPNLEERMHTDAGVFRNPQTERRVIDYYQCHQKSVADNVIHFCKEAKENWPRPLITGVFYGYFFYMYKAATGGHLEMERVLNSPYIDYFSAPFSYEDYARRVGGSGQFRAVVESIKLHGKIFIDEQDHPTHLGDVFGRKPPYAPADIPESISVFRRSVGQTLARGMGMWWYDFGPTGNSGWWDHPEYLRDIRKLKQLADEMLHKPYKSAADVLYVYDMQCFYYLGLPDGDVDPVSGAIINLTSNDTYHSGASFDTVLLMDLDKIDLRRYKVVVFVNTFLMNEDQRKFITEKVVSDGRSVVWLYAPGYTDGQNLNVERMSELTGMELEQVELKDAPQIVVSREALGVEDKVGSRVAVKFGMNVPVKPLFAVKDKSAIPLGRYSGTNYTALARKDTENAQIWYCGLPLRDPKLIQKILESGQAHIYNRDTSDVVYAGGDLLVIHSINGGKRTITLNNGKCVDMDLSGPSTVILDSETGEDVMR